MGRSVRRMFGGKVRAKKSKTKRSWHEVVDDVDLTQPDKKEVDKKEEWTKLKAELEERDRLVADNKRRLESADEVMSRTEVSTRDRQVPIRTDQPHVFMDVKIQPFQGDILHADPTKWNIITGRLVIELFEDIVPRTVRNFVALIKGDDRRKLKYLGSVFHRIMPKFMAQGGDVTKQDGSGGESIYGRYFEDESFLLKHTNPGVLAMANSGPNTNNSQFYITFNEQTHLDGKHVVFGKVVAGWDMLEEIGAIGQDDGKPKHMVKVEDCGVLDLKKKEIDAYFKPMQKKADVEQERMRVKYKFKTHQHSRDCGVSTFY